MTTLNIAPNLQTTNTDSGEAESEIQAYRLVKRGSTPGTVAPCTAITDIAIGVSLKHADAGQQCEYQTRGRAYIECSAGVAANAQVMPTASGAGKCSTASGATARSAGFAINTSANDGEIIACDINLPNLNGPANS